MTSRILAGDYPAALMMFDEVLRKGFSAQTFAAGLNGHFRDLLMCKNPQTLSLLEVTGSVAERYRSQAAECPVPLLFEGIDLLTAVEQSLLRDGREPAASRRTESDETLRARSKKK